MLDKEYDEAFDDFYDDGEEYDAEDWDETDTPEEVSWDEIDETEGLPRCSMCHLEQAPQEMSGALCFTCLAEIEEGQD